MKLYRHYDVEGRLLYVGITRNPTIRLSDHEMTSRWGDLIATITIEGFPSEKEAKEAERIAILRENPMYNIMRPKSPTTPPAPMPETRFEDWPEIEISDERSMVGMIDELMQRVRSGLQGLRLADVAADSGISRQTLWRIREGKTLPDPETLEAVEAALSTPPSGARTSSG